jgi:hypothetical protein
MKTIINKFKKACVLLGYYNQDKEYCEEIFEEIDLKKMHRSITRNVYLSHDITMHIVPGIEIRVFAKSRKDIETYLEIKGDANVIKGLFDCFSKYNKSFNGEYIYTTFELEEIRREKSL